MRKPSWRLLVPALVTLGLVAAGAPAALAGELDHDPVENGLNVRMLLRCNGDGTVTLKWHSKVPKGAGSMGVSWFDFTADPERPTPSTRADQVAAARVRGNRADGKFLLTSVPNGHRILVAVDAYSKPGGRGKHLDVLGHNLDTIRC
jgi:hypothetical protein